jgi:hypothetical protein
LEDDLKFLFFLNGRRPQNQFLIKGRTPKKKSSTKINLIGCANIQEAKRRLIALI